MLNKEKTRQKEGRRYFAGGKESREAQVVKSGDGYRLRG